MDPYQRIAGPETGFDPYSVYFEGQPV